MSVFLFPLQITLWYKQNQVLTDEETGSEKVITFLEAELGLEPESLDFLPCAVSSTHTEWFTQCGIRVSIRKPQFTVVLDAGCP